MECDSFFLKINKLFSFFNELGDEFSFINSKKEKILIELEDDSNITLFLNILLIGKTGSGKSTLINNLLNEEKCLIGGTGLRTSTKNLITLL